MRWEVVVEGVPDGVGYFPDRRFWLRSSAERHAESLNEEGVLAWLHLPGEEPVRWTVRRAT